MWEQIAVRYGYGGLVEINELRKALLISTVMAAAVAITDSNWWTHASAH